MTSRKMANRGLFALCTAILGSCGGGGGGSSTPPEPPFVAGPQSSLGATAPFDMAVGYFDGDARRDLILPGWIDLDQGEVLAGADCFLGRPDGRFAAVAPVTVGIPRGWDGSRVLPGHFDAGATLDFVVVSDRYYSVMLGNGDGTFAPASPAMNVLPGGLVASDAEIINARNDFYDDLVVATTTGDLVVLLCDDAGGFIVWEVLHPSPGHRIVDIVVAQMDGDGVEDVVALDDLSVVTVMLGDGMSLVFESSIVVGFAGEAKGILVGWFDLSPGMDLAVMRGPILADPPRVEVAVFRGDGTGGIGAMTGSVELPKASLGHVARAEHVGRGGEMGAFVVAAGDLVYGDKWTLYLVSLDPSGSGVPTAEEIPVSRPATTFKAADIDGDWLTDLVVVGAGDVAAGELPWEKFAEVLYGAVYFDQH